MSAIYKRGTARVSGNLTPMIDMTFLLIVFFVLVSRIVNNETAKMDLPQLIRPDTQRLAEENRVVINILPAASGQVDGYRLGGQNFPPDGSGLEAMTALLTELYRANPLINVNLRADRRTHYQFVEPVMQIVSDAARAANNAAGGARVNLVVSNED